MSEKQFRFQDLEIWKRGAIVSAKLFKLAENLERQHLFRFAEQLRAATLSITNNIAEGSGSASNADFANFLNIARRSIFEVANILVLLSQEDYFKPICEDHCKLNYAETVSILGELEEQSRMILAFRRNLKS